MNETVNTESPRLTAEDPDVIHYTTEYVRRLLAEAVYIYAAIENPGGSVILTNSGLIDADRTYEYSSRIGNPFHLDLIDLQQMMDKELSKGERDALLAWAAGLTPKQAAIYLSAQGSVKLIKQDAIRKRRERGIDTLTERFNEEDKDTKTTGEDSLVPARTLRKVPRESAGSDTSETRHFE